MKKNILQMLLLWLLLPQYFWNNFYPFPPKTKEDTTKYDLQHKTIFNLQGSATGNGTCYYFC